MNLFNSIKEKKRRAVSAGIVAAGMNSNAERKPCSKGCRRAKKVVMTVFAMAIAASMLCVTASAEINTGDFISKASGALKTVIILIGAGVGIWGVVNLLEGYGNDNPGAKAQ